MNGGSVAAAGDSPDWQGSRAHWAGWLAQHRVRSATLWRGVEAQHRVATLKLVDDLGEQELLEALLVESKPAQPPGAEHLHYLVTTPFRYISPWPSRFRAVHEPGIWYGASELRTACAEVGYRRWRFVTDSDAFADEPVVSELSFFPARVRGKVVDLTHSPWAAFAAAWQHSFDYSACHALAHAARDAGLDWIRYASVRDASHRSCGAVLRPAALQVEDLTLQQTWTCVARAASVLMTPTALGSDEPALEFRFT